LQVVGCHAKVLAVTDGESLEQYPTDDGNGCMCVNYTSANCVASCAKNIRNHEVRSEYGIGVVTVTCSEGNFVLGCSIVSYDPVATTNVDKCRTWAVKSIDSCECYGNDNNGATCYALCGEIFEVNE